MITDIKLTGFKCFEDLRVKPKLVTVLIGPNGTGKSGVLQSLLLLKQSKDASQRLDLDGDIIPFPPSDFLFHGDDAHFTYAVFDLAGRGIVQGEQVEFEVGLQYGADAAFLEPKRGAISFTYEGTSYNVHVGRRSSQERLELGVGVLTYVEGPGIDLYRLTGSSPDTIFQTFLKEVAGLPTRTLTELKWVPPTRTLSQLQYPIGPERHPHMSTSRGPSQMEEDAATNMAYSAGSLSQVSQWMKRVTGVELRAPIVPPSSIQPNTLSSAGEVRLTAEGLGTNSLVLLLFELAEAADGSTVLIEEPENHLHPRAQAELAAVMAQEAMSADKQVIMATHSEHLVNRLLTLVAEGTLLTDMLAIYSFTKDQNGACLASEIQVNERGQVTGGLTGFFDTNLDEMDRYVRALQKSQ